MYVPYGDAVIIVASQRRAPHSPVWHKNLVAHPDIEVQYKRRHMKPRARQVDDEAKARLWPVCLESDPPFDEYPARTGRNLPVFVCEP